MTLRTRLSLSLVVIAAVLVVPLLVARNSLERLKTDVRELDEVEFKASLVLGRLRDALGDVRAREVALNVVHTDTVRDQLNESLKRAITLADSLQNYKVDSSAARIALALAGIGTAAEAEYAALRADSSDKADTISQRTIARLLHDAERALIPAVQELGRRTSERVAAAEEFLVDAERYSLAALAVALLLATAIALWLTRSISEPVRALEEGMRAVADGELDHKLKFDVSREDEFGRLAASYREMSQQLAELDKLKAEFVSIASHELKTPINVILGYLQLMEEGVYGPLNDKQIQVSKTIQAQAKTLSRLAAQLLDVSRFEAGGGRIDPRPIKLPQMLDELERTFHVLAVQREINFHVTRKDGLPVDVVWDWERINEVTGNLLSNAFKFTPSGGSVELIAGKHENGVCIEVCDTGAGIAPDQLKRVFDKFFQADNQKSASAKGTGLGLAIAKEIVEAHQGKIRVSSVAGKGTTFTIVLPIAVVNRRRSSSYRVSASKRIGA
jgi:signal transduction histidine kinase